MVEPHKFCRVLAQARMLQRALTRRVVLSLLLVVLTAVSSPRRTLSAQGTELSEYQVKAAFVLNFLKFVEYPERSGDRSVLHVCVFGSPEVLKPFAGLNGKIAQGKPLLIHEFEAMGIVDTCDAIFISQSSKVSEERVLQAVGTRTVLTIGESSEFTAKGGVISFFSLDNRIRFKISTTQAQEQDLVLSSKLLALAVIE